MISLNSDKHLPRTNQNAAFWYFDTQTQLRCLEKRKERNLFRIAQNAQNLFRPSGGTGGWPRYGQLGFCVLEQRDQNTNKFTKHQIQWLDITTRGVFHHFLPDYLQIVRTGPKMSWKQLKATWKWQIMPRSGWSCYCQLMNIVWRGTSCCCCCTLLPPGSITGCCSSCCEYSGRLGPASWTGSPVPAASCSALITWCDSWSAWLVVKESLLDVGGGTGKQKQVFLLALRWRWQTRFEKGSPVAHLV